MILLIGFDLLDHRLKPLRRRQRCRFQTRRRWRPRCSGSHRWCASVPTSSSVSEAPPAPPLLPSLDPALAEPPLFWFPRVHFSTFFEEGARVCVNPYSGQRVEEGGLGSRSIIGEVSFYANSFEPGLLLLVSAVGGD